MNTHKLMQLLRDNAGTRAEGEQPVRHERDGDTSRIYIEGPIDPWWGASADAFRAALAAVNGPVHVHINSPGGDVFEARAMQAAVVKHNAEVHMHVDGLAASAASFFALRGNSLSLTRGGMLMVHEAWTVGYGNKAELRKTADLLEQIDADLVRDYAARTGKPEAEVKGWIEAETWFGVDDALALGFIDQIEPNTRRGQEASALAARWNLSAYKAAPKFEAPKPPPRDTVDVEHLHRQLQANRNRLRLLASI